MLIVCILLALLCAGLAFWVWAQRRSLREAAYRLRALEDTGSTARVRLAVPNSAAEELLDEVNRLLELRQADRAAYQARERALRQQIANVSHDLRTPLTSILGYLQLLEDPGLTEGERREYLAVIAGRARTLQSLITSFYDLSRLEGGEYLLQREKVDLYASLSGLLAAFYNDFTDRGFDMEVELAEGLPQVWADAGAVLRIFTNLIRNALEHGEGRMEIRLYQEGGQVVSRFSNETHALTASLPPTRCAPAGTPAWAWPLSKRWPGRWTAGRRPLWRGICLPSPSAGRLSGGNRLNAAV